MTCLKQFDPLHLKQVKNLDPISLTNYGILMSNCSTPLLRSSFSIISRRLHEQLGKINLETITLTNKEKSPLPLYFMDECSQLPLKAWDSLSGLTTSTLSMSRISSGIARSRFQRTAPPIETCDMIRSLRSLASKWTPSYSKDTVKLLGLRMISTRTSSIEATSAFLMQELYCHDAQRITTLFEQI
jgi:hypothetical protein